MNASPILTPAQIRELDRRAIEDCAVPSLTLMQNAAGGIAHAVLELIVRRRLHRTVGIVAGKGNNGGDGFAASMILASHGLEPIVLALYPLKELSKDAAHFYRKAKTQKAVTILDCSTPAHLRKHFPRVAHCSVLVDGIVGTGFKGEPNGLVADAIACINDAGVRSLIVAADVPSGLDATTGKAEMAVRADITVTMGFCKSGFLLHDAMNYIGSLRVVDIGIPEALSNKIVSSTRCLDSGHVASLLQRRARISHKGNYGHLLVVGGSAGMSGAPVLCARAALRAGSGLVTVACPEAIQPTVAQGCTEAMTLGLPAINSAAVGRLKDASQNKKFDAMILGPGLGRDADTQDFVLKALEDLELPMVVDADALFAIASSNFGFKTARSKNIILTPHLGEFAQLLHTTTEKIKNDWWGKMPTIHANNEAVVVVKSHITAISDSESGVFISFAGNAGMASAGMGDVLSGVIGSLLGQGLTAMDAAKAGVFIHGSAGDFAFAHKGNYGLIASDVIESIPQAIMELPIR